MSTVLRRNRKGSDAQIIRLNSIGLSLTAIGNIIGCHPTSITLRLKSLGIPPADTRRAFMEDVFNALPANFRELIADHLADNGSMSIKDYVTRLIQRDVDSRQHNHPADLGDLATNVA